MDGHARSRRTIVLKTLRRLGQHARSRPRPYRRRDHSTGAMVTTGGAVVQDRAGQEVTAIGPGQPCHDVGSSWWATSRRHRRSARRVVRINEGGARRSANEQGPGRTSSSCAPSSSPPWLIFIDRCLVAAYTGNLDPITGGAIWPMMLKCTAIWTSPIIVTTFSETEPLDPTQHRRGPDPLAQRRCLWSARRRWFRMRCGTAGDRSGQRQAHIDVGDRPGTARRWLGDRHARRALRSVWPSAGNLRQPAAGSSHPVRGPGIRVNSGQCAPTRPPRRL